MNMRKIILLIAICPFIAPHPSYTSSLFHTMATNITQQLFPITQQLTSPSSDPQIQQLVRSVFSQLQSTTQTKDIKNVIDIILNVLTQRQSHDEKIGIMLSVTVMAHSLRIIAQKLYRSISFVRKSLLYWKKVDQQTLLHYCMQHIPTLWSAKFNSGFFIKQKILQTEKLYAAYVAQLGLITRLIYQVPRTTNNVTNIVWINEVLTALKKYSSQQSSEVITKPFNTILLLKHIKTFLDHFDNQNNNEFEQVKSAIGLPSYGAHNFGKIMANIVIIGGIFFSSYYYANEIGTWYENTKNNIKKHIWEPIYDNAKAIFSTQEKDLLLDVNEIKKDIQFAEDKQHSLGKKLEFLGHLPQAQDAALKTECVTLLNDFANIKEIKNRDVMQPMINSDTYKGCTTPELTAEKMIELKDWSNLLSVLGQVIKNRYRWDLKDIVADFATTFPNILILLLRDFYPELLEMLKFFYGSVGHGLKAGHRMDMDSVLARKLFILTPALFTIAGAYKAGSKVYEYATQKDYSSLKLAFKELETTTICARNQPENDSSYGLFIFLLETLKIGVVKMLPSRYTDKNELLEDLKRLESPHLTFKQRLKLIEQIRRSYSIFKQS